MTDAQPKPDDRFVELATHYFDGLADEAEFAELSQLLREDEAARATFVRLSLQARLVRHLISPRLLLDMARQEQAIGPIAEVKPARRWWIGATAFAAAAMIAIAVSLTWVLMHQGTVNEFTPATTGPFVATLTDAQNAQWGGDGKAPVIGGELRADKLELVSGTAQVMFRKGAVVTLEGPADFELQTINSGRLLHGQMTAWVPHPAKGFTVAAPGGAVVDLGTEFGMVVDSASSSQVQVFEGTIEVQLKDAADRVIDRRTLTARQTALLVMGQTKILSGQNVAHRFAFRLPVDTPRYADAVRANDPWAYWPLINVDGRSRLDDLGRSHYPLHAGTEKAADMLAQLDTREPARFDGETILGPGSGRYHWGLASNAAFSVEAWLWPDAMNDDGCIMLAEPGTGKAGWSLLYHPADENGGQMVLNLLGVGTLRFDKAPIPRGCWSHVAVTFDAEHVARLYVDGKLKQAITAPGPMHVSDDNYVKIGGRAAGLRWVGRMAHLAYYSTALSAEQIARHAQSGEMQ